MFEVMVMQNAVVNQTNYDPFPDLQVYVKH